jgi:hypothetical protein
VTREQDRDPGRSLLGDEGPDHGPCLRVHPGRRFVQDQHLGPAHERKGKAEPLPLPARQAAERGRRHGPESQHVQQLGRITRRLVESGVLLDGLERSRPQVDAAGLQHQADPGAQRPAAARRFLAQDADAPRIGASITLDDLDGRRLAGPVRPEHGDQLAGCHAERHTVDHGSTVVALDQVLDDDRAGGHGAIRA